MSAENSRYWFADVDQDQSESSPYRWQPCFETGEGLIPSLPLWFASREECEDWIRLNVIGAPLDARAATVPSVVVGPQSTDSEDA